MTSIFLEYETNRKLITNPTKEDLLGKVFYWSKNCMSSPISLDINNVFLITELLPNGDTSYRVRYKYLIDDFSESDTIKYVVEHASLLTPSVDGYETVCRILPN